MWMLLSQKTTTLTLFMMQALEDNGTVMYHLVQTQLDKTGKMLM